MGRHSAPDSDEEQLSASAVIATSVVVSGRHAGTDGEASAPVEVAPVEVAPVAVPAADTPPPAALPQAALPQAALAQAAAPKATAQVHSGTRGDLHLLRESRSLRARCAAAVLVPFVIFTILLIALGRTDVYLIWIWIPTVLA